MVKQRSFSPGMSDDANDPSAAFLDALRTQAMDEMHVAALEYGIVLKDLGTCTALSERCSSNSILSCHGPAFQGRDSCYNG
jgi:hypothetical protein